MGVLLTVVNLLKCDLGVLWETLHSLAGKHERLRLLRRRHDSILLRIHIEDCKQRRSVEDVTSFHWVPHKVGQRRADVPSNTQRPQLLG